jgi:penicillin-binding protein 2
VQGIELPLEAAGNLPPSRDWKAQIYGEPWSTGDDYNMGIGQGFMTATPLQVVQMAAVIANGGFLYRPSIIHHMSDEDGNIVIVDDNSEIVARAYQGEDGQTVLLDADGNPLDDASINVQFDENGNYVYQPEVLNAVEVDREYLELAAEGMRIVNSVDSEGRPAGTGTSYVTWLADVGLITAGKTGTSEYCDNIAIKRGWCRFEERAIQPTHAFYVGYAPLENAEIAVMTFIFNGGEGSQWAAAVSCHVLAAYFDLGQYADGLTATEWQETMRQENRVCNTFIQEQAKWFVPIVEPLEFAPEPVNEGDETILPQPVGP